MERNMIEMLLFDLGGVLVEFTGIEPLITLTRGKLDREGARRFWLESPWLNLYETGGCTAQEYAAGVVADLDIDLEPDAFLREFISWEIGPYPGAMDLLDRLGQKYTLACLTNNNEVHWKALNDMCGIAGKFNKCYVSYLIGCKKPALQIFSQVLQDCGVSADKILFFDDNPECVQGAQLAGIQGYCVREMVELNAKLKILGMLPE